MDAGSAYAPLLPIAPNLQLYVEGIAPDVAAEYGQVVARASEADLAIVRLQAPYEPRDHYFLEAAFHQGTLEFAPQTVERLRALAAQVPVVVDVFLDRPAILNPLLQFARALVADFGASDRALLDALSGRIPPRGRLPFDLPRSTEAVVVSRPDVSGDTADPIRRAGDGVTLV